MAMCCKINCRCKYKTEFKKKISSVEGTATPAGAKVKIKTQF